MELTKVEWSKAQELLVKLVQVLSPLTDRSLSSSFSVSQHFFIPTAAPENLDRFHRPFSIITTLHSVQKQVEEMITKTAAAEPVEQEKRKPSVPLFEKEISKFKAPLTIQAQKLIGEVQEAIGQLCHSTQIKDPKGAPLREALKRLKPNLDRIIEMVISEEKEISTQSDNPSVRFASPVSSRQSQIRKQVVFSETEQKVDKAMKKESRNSPSSIVEKEKSIARGIRSVSTKLTEKTVTVSPSEEKQVFKQQIHQTGVLRPSERTSLPALPFVPMMRNLTSSLAKKKKRKGFWFREEEEDRNTP